MRLPNYEKCGHVKNKTKLFTHAKGNLSKNAVHSDNGANLSKYWDASLKKKSEDKKISWLKIQRSHRCCDNTNTKKWWLWRFLREIQGPNKSVNLTRFHIHKNRALLTTISILCWRCTSTGAACHSLQVSCNHWGNKSTPIILIPVHYHSLHHHGPA